MSGNYLCIDLKSFFASVECAERHLDPMQADLVVADPSRGQGALCLAVSVHLKTQGVKNRCRIFDIPEDIAYITAVPRMKLYLDYSARIYSIYLKYIAKEDIHVYSIDEAFLDVTPYLRLYHMSARQLAQRILNDIKETTTIQATAGIGTNLYLAKIALDLIAKHAPDFIGVLDEQSYREKLWHHQPLSDFWQIGHGYERRLAGLGLYDMYDIAHCQPQLLYDTFGVNAEYLRDHALGIEPTTIQEIHAYRPQSTSISNSQILFEDYSFTDARLVLKEMIDTNILRLAEKHLVAGQVALGVGYSKDALPPVNVAMKLDKYTASHQELFAAFLKLYDRHVDRDTKIRRIGISFGRLQPEARETVDLFTDQEALEKEHALDQALLKIKNKYGKNAVLKGMNLCAKATAIRRNQLIGGHNAE